MPIRNLLNKVSESGYGVLSDAEFDTLKEFTSANPQYKSLFNKVSEQGYGVLSDAEFEGLKKIPETLPAVDKTKGYQYATPQQGQDLLSRVRYAGYSRLSPDEKALFDRQYSYSQAGRRGMTLQQVRDYADANANPDLAPQPNLLDVAKSIPGNVYQGTRDILAKTVGGPLSSWLSATDKYNGVPDPTSPTGVRSVKRLPGMNYFERVAADQPGEIERGMRGEGLPGIMSDPTNLTMAIPAVGEARIASLMSKIPRYGETIAGLRYAPAAGSALVNGLINAGVAGTSAYVDPLRGSATDVTGSAESAGLSPLTQAAIAGGVGGTLSLFGKGAETFGSKHYPHGETIIGKQLDRGGAGDIEDLINNTMGTVSFPYTQSQYRARIGANLDKAGEGFEQALGAIPKHRIPVQLQAPVAPSVVDRGRITYTNAADFRRDLARGLGAPAEPRLLTDAELTLQHQKQFPRSIDPDADVQRIADYAESGRLADIQGDATVHSVLPQDVQSAMEKRRAGLEQALSEQKNKFGDLTREEQDLLGSIGDVKDIKDLSKLRRMYATQFRPSANTDERVGQYADELYHAAIVRRMKEEPEYAQSLLESGAEKSYALNSILGKYAAMNLENPRGVARQMPWLLNNYVGPTVIYKAGKLMQRPGVANWLTRGLGLAGTLRDMSRSDTAQ